jgi:hypothetical protein
MAATAPPISCAASPASGPIFSTATNAASFESARAAAKAVGMSQGTRTDQLGANVTKLAKGKGSNQAAYLLRRIARERPDILDRYERGEFFRFATPVALVVHAARAIRPSSRRRPPAPLRSAIAAKTFSPSPPQSRAAARAPPLPCNRRLALASAKSALIGFPDGKPNFTGQRRSEAAGDAANRFVQLGALADLRILPRRGIEQPTEKEAADDVGGPKKTSCLLTHTTGGTPMIAWRQSGNDDFLFHNDDPRPKARLRKSSEFDDLWMVVAPKTLPGEHLLPAARSFAERLCGAARMAGASQ